MPRRIACLFPAFKEKSLRPHLVRYMSASCISFALGLLQYNLLYSIVPVRVYRSTTCWVLSFFIGTLWVHALHRWFTFKDMRRRPYFSSLMRTYLGYAGTQTIGAIAMLMCCDIGHWNHTAVWIAVSSVLSLFTFPFLRHFALARENESA